MTFVCNPVLETDTIRYSIQPGCAFLDPGYYPGTKQAHSGIDLNDVRGGDSDLGNRVRAVADGVVVAAGTFPKWGGIVLIHHPDLGVWTQYGHVYGITVQVGQTVRMGDIIGQIGKMEGNRGWAHLHFEVRRSLLPPDFWASNRYNTRRQATDYIREHYHDPEDWLAEHGALRTLAEVEVARGERRGGGVVVDQPSRAVPLNWYQLHDEAMQPLEGEWVSVVENTKTRERRVVKVGDKKLREAGLI
ncbi:murein DD-endopeptidase MepM/ murein hydrolase activator NlpD [Deinococcus sp. HSC-46F16]|uniref:M23 family metallopeptidase n=1 Tax=Deinococcus sp. HSC-46F16 TaxID=2910968 RepID=UPI00209EA98C|nr:M23 family metallopeptidase [Deinococcus sp. HSC-46F16]MCP2015604.1 murein DD-endopeptidase MepM/ murein hydrolase activator NlpD [Deinococcus sp. HSC-46F16]